VKAGGKQSCSYETLDDVQYTTQCYYPKDSTLHNQHRENLKSLITLLLSINTSRKRNVWAISHSTVNFKPFRWFTNVFILDSSCGHMVNMSFKHLSQILSIKSVSSKAVFKVFHEDIAYYGRQWGSHCHLPSIGRTCQCKNKLSLNRALEVPL
jgi:hypothetical protein